MGSMRTLLDQDSAAMKLLSRPRENALLAEPAEAVVSVTALFEGEAWHGEVQRFTECLVPVQ